MPEIALPTKPLEDVNDENGEIALCTLSAFNLGAIDSLDELEELAVLAVRALDALLDYQDYPIPAAKRGAMGRRTLGIGVINFAYYLAKHGKRYSDGSANNLTHKTFEAIQYYLLKASNELAIEQGACPWFNETTYAQGILPIDTYKKDLDGIVSEPLHYDWEALRESIKTHGLRNSTLSALMPSETSSQISNATNGIEPPRHVSIKASKDGILRRGAGLRKPAERLRAAVGDAEQRRLSAAGGYHAEVYRPVDLANTNYDPTRFPSGKVPMQQLLKDLLNAYKFGVKTLYYHNTRDGAEDAQMTAPSIQTTAAKAALVRSKVFLPGNATLTRPTLCRPGQPIPAGQYSSTGLTSMAYTTFHRRKRSAAGTYVLASRLTWPATISKNTTSLKS